MAALDERVSYLEGRVEEHARHIDGIREAIVSLEGRLDRRLESLGQRVDARCTSLEQRVEARCGSLEQRCDGLDAKMSRQFVWLVGMQVTTLASVLGAFAAVVAAFAP